MLIPLLLKKHMHCAWLVLRLTGKSQTSMIFLSEKFSTVWGVVSATTDYFTHHMT